MALLLDPNADAGVLLLQSAPPLLRDGGPDVLLRLTGRTDLFAYFGCRPSEPPEARAAAVSARRRWAQGQRDNPKFRAEAEALLRSYDACFRAVVDAPPVEVVARSAATAVPDDEDVDDPVTDTEGLWRLPPPVPRLTVAASRPGARAAGLPAAGPWPRPAPSSVRPKDVGGAASPPLNDAAPLRRAISGGARPDVGPMELTGASAEALPAFADSVVALLSSWWRTLFFRVGRDAPAVEPTGLSFGGPPLSMPPLSMPPPLAPSPGPLLDATEPPPWAGLDRLATGGFASLRTSILEHLYALRDAAPGPAEVAFLERLLRTCSVSQLQFPLFPDSALELQAAIADEDVSFTQLSSIVRRDPALLQRVWEEASGAAYGRQRPPTVDAAVVRIGRKAIWRIGMRACVNAPVFRVRGWQERANELRSAGIVAAEVAESLDPSGAAFLPALLHGVGRLLVYRAAAPRPPRPTPDRAWVERIARSLQAPLGALVAETWQLGAPVSAGIGFLPDPAQAGNADRRTAEVVRAAVIATHEARANAARRTYGGGALLVESGLTEAQSQGCMRVAAAAWTRVPHSPHAGAGG